MGGKQMEEMQRKLTMLKHPRSRSVSRLGWLGTLLPPRNGSSSKAESQLQAYLDSFLETARSFNFINTKEIRPWTHMMEVPQLLGFGPAANFMLEEYKMLLKFLGNLRNLRDSFAALAVGSSETIAGEPSAVTRIISERESGLTFLNRDLGIRSASIARERGNDSTV